MQSVWRDNSTIKSIMKSRSPECEGNNDAASSPIGPIDTETRATAAEAETNTDTSPNCTNKADTAKAAVNSTPATALSRKMEGKLHILAQSPEGSGENDEAAEYLKLSYGKPISVPMKAVMPPVPQTQLRMRRVNSTPCVSTSFSDSTDPLIPSTKSSDQVFDEGFTVMSHHQNIPTSSPKNIFLEDSPMKMSPHYANLMQPSPTLNTVASTVLKNFPSNKDKISTESILKSAPPTPFPELEADHGKLVDASYMMSPSAGGEKTPRSSDPAFSWFNVNSPSLKSPKIIGNASMFSGNFFSDAADLGFADKQQSPAPYLKQNAKLPFSPVSTRGGHRSIEEKHADVTMDAAERDVMEDEDLCLLIKLAHSQGVSYTRTPSQRATDNSTTTTTDILTASSLHLPHIPSVANSNAFRSTKKDGSSNGKSEWQPPLLKPSGSFHSTKITRMDSYGTSGVAKLTLSGSKSADTVDQKSEPPKSSTPVEHSNSQSKQNLGHPPQPFMRPSHQAIPFHTAIPGGPPGFIHMPPLGYPVTYCPPPPTSAMQSNNVGSLQVKKKSPSKKRNVKSSKNKTPSKKKPSQTLDGADGDAGLLRGVTMRPSGKWQAQLYYAGKSRYIGVFDTRENAATAYEIARQKLKNAPGGDNSDTPSDPAAIEAAVQAARTAAFEGVSMSLKK